MMGERKESLRHGRKNVKHPSEERPFGTATGQKRRGKKNRGTNKAAKGLGKKEGKRES